MRKNDMFLVLVLAVLAVGSWLFSMPPKARAAKCWWSAGISR